MHNQINYTITFFSKGSSYSDGSFHLSSSSSLSQLSGGHLLVESIDQSELKITLEHECSSNKTAEYGRVVKESFKLVAETRPIQILANNRLVPVDANH
jgi:hypothetical protein